ncbi:hypothetical protein LMG24235_05064 [Paraburkholderia sabiae]|nr:hypothetical protein LMG24235_05064 [Paraburkholderia sabiae]
MTSTWGTFGRRGLVRLPSAQLRRYVLETVCGIFALCAVDCGLSTECGRRCAIAQLRHAAAPSWQAPEVQKRLSFAYFSLPRQRKVGAAPHRGNASKPTRKRGCQRNPKPKNKTKKPEPRLASQTKKNHCPATVIRSIKTEPVCLVPRTIVSAPIATTCRNISCNVLATVISSTGYWIFPFSTQNPDAPRE